MIYLDNAATSFPKPRGVSEAMRRAVDEYGGNPGRSGHSLSMRASEEIFKCRNRIKKMFNAKSEENVIFTMNATMALNICINGLVDNGSHVVISDMEHNSVSRPLFSLKRVEITAAAVSFSDDVDSAENFRKAIRKDTKFFIFTHASNVCGNTLPVKAICDVAHENGIRVILDASQTAGIMDIDVQSMGIDYLCAAGHKGMYGPQGSGFVIINNDRIPAPLIAGGTGSASVSVYQPDFLPDMHESGTLSTPAIAGLNAGITFLTAHGIENLHRQEMLLMGQAYKYLTGLKSKGVVLYTGTPRSGDAPVLSFNLKNIQSSEAAELYNKYGICVRGGYHCAPSAHKKTGTLDSGTVRIAAGVFNTEREIAEFAAVTEKILKI